MAKPKAAGWRNGRKRPGARHARAGSTAQRGGRSHRGAGQRFPGPSANQDLRKNLRSGELDAQDYYRQLLRLVYRLIFLFAAEDRDLLLDPQADTAARDRYLRYYSTARLRRLAERQRGGRHADLWQGLKLMTDMLGGKRSGEWCASWFRLARFGRLPLLRQSPARPGSQPGGQPVAAERHPFVGLHR